MLCRTRTTLNLDKDVAAALKRVCRARKASLDSVVNEALRQGLRCMSTPATAKRKNFRTRTLQVGRCLVDNVDNVAEVLTLAANERFR